MSCQDAAQARGNKRLLRSIEAKIAVDLPGDEPVRMIVKERCRGAAGDCQRRKQQYGQQEASCAGDDHDCDCLTGESAKRNVKVPHDPAAVLARCLRTNTFDNSNSSASPVEMSVSFCSAAG